MPFENFGAIVGLLFGFGALLFLLVALVWALYRACRAILNWEDRRVLGKYGLIRNGMMLLRPLSSKERREIAQIEAGK